MIFLVIYQQVNVFEQESIKHFFFSSVMGSEGMFLIHLDLLNLVMVHIFTKSKEFKNPPKQGLTFKCDHLTVLVYRSGTNFHLLPP